MKKISVIIVTYNSTDLIIDCINSIYKFSDIDAEYIEIIVVDNSPDEESQKMFNLLKQTYGDKLILIKNQKNLGYGHGNNIGINNASGEIICIMNPDVRLSEPIFFHTITEFENDKQIGMLGYKQIGGLDFSFYIKPEYYIPILNSILIRILNKFNFYFPKYCFLSGAFLFINKEKFMEIGLFDINFFLYREETDISNRFRNKKIKTKFISKKKYHHLVGDRSEFSEFKFRTWLISSLYYIKKHRFNKNVFLRKLILEYKIHKIIDSFFFKKIKAKNNSIKIDLIKKQF